MVEWTGGSLLRANSGQVEARERFIHRLLTDAEDFNPDAGFQKPAEERGDEWEGEDEGLVIEEEPKPKGWLQTLPVVCYPRERERKFCKLFLIRTPMWQKKVSLLYSEVSSFQRLKCMQEWYILGVSCVERCPQLRSVLIEKEVPLLCCFRWCRSCKEVQAGEDRGEEGEEEGGASGQEGGGGGGGGGREE